MNLWVLVGRGRIIDDDRVVLDLPSVTETGRTLLSDCCPRARLYFADSVRDIRPDDFVRVEKFDWATGESGALLMQSNVPYGGGRYQFYLKVAVDDDA